MYELMVYLGLCILVLPLFGLCFYPVYWLFEKSNGLDKGLEKYFDKNVHSKKLGKLLHIVVILIWVGLLIILFVFFQVLFVHIFGKYLLPIFKNPHFI